VNHVRSKVNYHTKTELAQALALAVLVPSYGQAYLCIVYVSTAALMLTQKFVHV